MIIIIGEEVRGGEEPQGSEAFYQYKLNTARWSHLRPL